MRNSSAQSFILFGFSFGKKLHFGASLRCTGIKVCSLGINTYCLQERSKLKYLNTCIVNDKLFKKYLSFNHSFRKFQ